MWNGTTKQLNAIMRIEYVTCEIHLFPPWISHVSQGAVHACFSIARAIGPERKVGKVGMGIRGTGNGNAMGHGGTGLL